MGRARTARSNGGSATGEAEPATEDPVVAFMEQSTSIFMVTVVNGILGAWKDLFAVKTFAAAPPAGSNADATNIHTLKEVKMIEDVQKRLWATRDDARKLERRLKKQTERVSKKINKKQAVKMTGVSAPKSKARQEAGKRKSESLKSWNQDFATAVAALKAQGYAGTLKIKRGFPVYEKIQEIRQGRLCASNSGSVVNSSGACASNSGSVVNSSGADAVMINVGSIQEAPADIRLQAKRGDASVSVVGSM